LEPKSENLVSILCFFKSVNSYRYAAEDVAVRDAHRDRSALFAEQRGKVDRAAFADDLKLVADPGSTAERASSAAADARAEMKRGDGGRQA
jgi:hypothetical protein